MSTFRDEVPVESAIVAEADYRAAEADACEVPIPRDPIAIRHVAGHPDVSCARARRNVSHRPAYAKTKFSCLRRSCAHSGRASHHRCSQHPIPCAAHNPSIPAGRSNFRDHARSGFSFRWRFGSCCLCGVPVMY
jgi:hypothetical protein